MSRVRHISPQPEAAFPSFNSPPPSFPPHYPCSITQVRVWTTNAPRFGGRVVASLGPGVTHVVMKPRLPIAKRPPALRSSTALAAAAPGAAAVSDAWLVAALGGLQRPAATSFPVLGLEASSAGPFRPAAALLPAAAAVLHATLGGRSTAAGLPAASACGAQVGQGGSAEAGAASAELAAAVRQVLDVRACAGPRSSCSRRKIKENEVCAPPEPTSLPSPFSSLNLRPL